MSGAALQLQLWRLQTGALSDAELRRGLSWLGADEIAYFRACQSTVRKRQFALGRLLLRGALSHLARERAPVEWRFVPGPHGRPELAEGQPFIGFNLAHSEDRIVLVTGPLPALGVDLEDGGKPRNVEGLARRWFKPEELVELMRLPAASRLPWFYRCWTIKEAWSKAQGAALAPSLRRITVTGATGGDGDGDAIRVAVSGCESAWRCYLPEAGNGFHCALVCRSEGGIRLVSRRMTGLARFESMNAGAPTEVQVRSVDESRVGLAHR